VAAAQLIGSRPNYLVVDEHGYYHFQVSGTIEEVVASTELHLKKMLRIKAQKEHS
jgi:hypothetical protein